MTNTHKNNKKIAFGIASAVLVASAVVPTVVQAKSFSDVPTDYTHFPAINALSDAGIINGYPNNTFKPLKTLTRSDVVKLLGKYLITLGYTIPTDYKTNIRFNDLNASSNDELLKYAALVYDQGVFIGDKGNLKASGNMTRENMALVIIRAFNAIEGKDFIAEYLKSGATSSIKDLSLAKAEAQPYIKALEYYDVTVVDNYRPKETTQRGQFASFLYRAIDNLTDANKLTVDLASLKFSSDGKTLSGKVTGGKAGTVISLYNADGKLLGSTTLKADGSFVITLSIAVETGETVFLEIDNTETVISVPKLIDLEKITGASLKYTSDGKSVSGQLNASQAGRTITVKNGTTQIGTGKVGNDGKFTIALSPAVKKGDKLTFTLSDNAGNSVVSDLIEVPDITSSNVLLKDSVKFTTGGTKVSGHVNNPFTGSTVTAKVGTTPLGSGIVATDGSYSFNLSPVANENDIVTLSITDTSGIQGQAISVTVPDITAPKAVTIEDLAFDNTGSSVTGSANVTEAGGKVEVKNATGTIIGTSYISSKGTYTVLLNPKVNVGDKITVTLTDSNGNSSTSSQLTVPTLQSIKAVNDIATASINAIEEGTLGDISSTQFNVAHIALGPVAGVNVVDIEGAIDLVIPENTVYDLTATITSNTVLGGSAVSLNVYKKDANGVFQEYYTNETAAGGILGIPLGGEGYPLSNLTAGEYTIFANPGVGLGILSNFTTTLSDIKTYRSLVTQTATPITGNVLTNDQKGTKNTKVLKIGNTAVTPAGSTATSTYGTVTMKSDGSYSYTPNGNYKSIGKIDTITYTIQNDVGQTSQAKLLVRIDSPDATINWGSSTNETLPTLMTVANDSANTSITRNGTKKTTLSNNFAGGFTIQDRETVITFDAYSLNGNKIIIKDANGTVVKNIEVPASALVQPNLTFTNLPAGYYTAEFARASSLLDITNITLVDQVDQVWNTPAATGNILTNDSTGSTYTSVNVQSPLTNSFVGVGTNTTLAGKFGTLVISENGEYSYTPYSTVDSVNKIETFTYQLIYPNGDTINATLQINIGGSVAVNFNVDGTTGAQVNGELAFNLSDANLIVATFDANKLA